MSRPLARPASISRNSSNASVTSMGSTMSRPSLLVADRTSFETPWQVNDARLRPVPAFYPPMNPRCTGLITDASPSTVAARISDALGRRSISVEYDDESQTATCMTVDRVHFAVHLWRGHKALTSLDDVNAIPDFSHAVIVEVVRLRGNVISFHRACHAVLQSAFSFSSGEDERKPFQTSVLEFPRLKGRDNSLRFKRPALADPVSQSVLAMEHAVLLLKKDRIRAQQLGMESLVNLTDGLCCGPELAMHVSLAVLGHPVPNGEAATDNLTLTYIHSVIFQLIRDRMLPGEMEEPDQNIDKCFQSSSDTNTAKAGEAKDNATTGSDTSRSIPLGDEHHGGLMRSMALRVLANALTTVDIHYHDLLIHIIAGSVMESRSVLQALAEDLLGATRPPAVVAGTRLASAHDTTLVMKCLRLIAQNSEKAKTLLVNPKNQEHPILDTLLRAKSVPHANLQRETTETYDFLSQDVRTC